MTTFKKPEAKKPVAKKPVASGVGSWPGPRKKG